MTTLEKTLKETERSALVDLGNALIDQEKARVIVAPERNKAGYWFGSGNLTVGPDGALYLPGRYRNYGDSRSGLGAGERGKELAVFQSTDAGKTFEKVISFSKDDLSAEGREVLSIEGSHLVFGPDGVMLYFSTEKKGIPYPDEVREYHKPGTGVWTIDCLRAESVEGLAHARVESVVESARPEHLHVKDPFIFHVRDTRVIGYCSHPFTWASSNTAFARNGEQIYDTFPRGAAWDVAIARMTCYAPVPKLGQFRDAQDYFLCFYDGGECVRPLEDHSQAVKRPRGYSCEEIGGLAVVSAESPLLPTRLSVHSAAFVSPWGTGCSRYVDVLFTDEWAYATWQQSQSDYSQPLVMNALPMADVERILS